MLRRFVTLAISFSLVLALGITRADRLFAQGEAKKDAQTPKTEPTAKEAPKTDTAKGDATKKEQTPTEASKVVEPPLPPIPPEVMAKIEAARKAVAEAIVAAQDAGLVDTSIDPPPILDILIDGRAIDGRILKSTTAKKPYGLSIEAFGAWFTGWGKLEGVNYIEDVKIVSPSNGLKRFYDERARIFGQLIQDIRKAKGPAPAAKKDATDKAGGTPKPDAAKPAAEPKK